MESNQPLGLNNEQERDGLSNSSKDLFRTREYREKSPAKITTAEEHPLLSENEKLRLEVQKLKNTLKAKNFSEHSGTESEGQTAFSSDSSGDELEITPYQRDPNSCRSPRQEELLTPHNSPSHGEVNDSIPQHPNNQDAEPDTRMEEELIISSSPPEVDPLSLIYFPPPTATPYFEGACQADSISFRWEGMIYGSFMVVNPHPLSFKFRQPLQLTIYRNFAEQCTTSPQDKDRAQRDTKHYPWSLHLFSNEFKSRTGISASTGYPNLTSEGPLPSSDEFLETLEKVRENHPMIESLKKDLSQSELQRTIKGIKAQSDKKRSIKNVPFTSLDFPNDKLCQLLTAPMATEHQLVSDLTLGSTYFKIPSEETLAKHLLSKQDVLKHLSLHTCLHTALEALEVFRSTIKDKIFQEDLNYLEAIQHWLKHVQQGENRTIHQGLEKLGKLHLLLRNEACSHQQNESLLTALLFKGPIADKYVLNPETTKEIVNLPDSHRLILPLTEQRATPATSQQKKQQPASSYPSTSKPYNKRTTNQALPSTSKRSFNTTFRGRYQKTQKRATQQIRSSNRFDPCQRRKTRPQPYHTRDKRN